MTAARPSAINLNLLLLQNFVSACEGCVAIGIIRILSYFYTFLSVYEIQPINHVRSSVPLEPLVFCVSI